MMPFVRSPYNYDMGTRETALVCEAETLTKQEFKDECDINTILKRFNITGQLPDNVRMPTFADFTELSTFHEAANAIAVAREAFDEMPAEVRRRFQNDPGEFVEFCSNPANIEEARKLGLVPVAEVVAIPAPAQVSGSGSTAPAAVPAATPPPGGPGPAA